MSETAAEKSAKPKKKYNRVGQGTYELLLGAYRDRPGNYSNAARVAEIDFKTAKRGWLRGWDNKSASMPPIRTVLKAEQKMARANIERAAERRMLIENDGQVPDGLDAEMIRERARSDAIRAREEEGNLIRLCRSSALHIAGAMAKLGPTAVALARYIEQETLKELAAGTLTRNQANRTLGTLTRRFTELAPAAKTIQEMERLYLGEPTEIIKQVTDVDDMSYEELFEQVEGASDLLQKAQDRGLICLDGGKNSPDPELEE